MEKQYRNTGFIFILFLPLTFFGFYKTYFIVSPEFEGTVDIYDHIHAVIASLWITLLITQPLLIRYRNYQLHQRFGKASYFIFPALILTFIPQMIKSHADGKSLLHPVFDLLLLLLFYSLAVKNKKNMGIHMRYMIAVALIFIGPTLARILIFWINMDPFWVATIPWGSMTLIVIVLMFWDKSNNRIYKPYVVASIGFMTYLLSLYVELF